MPLNKHKNRTTSLSDAAEPKDEPKPDNEKPKDSSPPTKPLEGSFCCYCGQKRVECAGKDCHQSNPADKAQDKNELKSPAATTEDSKPSDSAWTVEQDNTIKAMKSDNRTWNEIAAAIGASKKDVQQRFKTLKAEMEGPNKVYSVQRPNAKPAVAATKSIAEPATKATSKPATSTAAKPTSSNELTVEDLDFGKLFLDEDSGDDGGASSNGAPFSTLTGYEAHRAERRSRKEGVKKQQARWWDPEDNDSDVFNMPPPPQSYGTSRFPKPVSSYAPAPTHMRRPRLQPDMIWSADDCHLLEELEAKDSKDKWQRLQVDFYNWSGRMVDPSLIELKFRQDGFN